MISFLVGALLGQRFQVMVLVPAIAIAFVLAIGTGVRPAHTGWAIVLISTAATMQIGYFAGLVIRHLVAGKLTTSTARDHRTHTA
jgi:hypothetical protein